MAKRPPAIVTLLTLLMVSGCPSEYGRDGRIDQAVEQDLKAEPSECPPGQRHRIPGRDCLSQECEGCTDDDGDGGR